MNSLDVHADLSVQRGSSRMRVRASGDRVVVSLSPLSAWRLRGDETFAAGSLDKLLHRAGLSLEVRCLGIRLRSYGNGGA